MKKENLMRQLGLKVFIFTLLTSLPISRLYSQVTIGKIVKQIDTTYVMPEPYDSLCDFGERKFNEYIGLQFYLPPLSNPKAKQYIYGPKPLLYTKNISVINVDTANRQVWYVNENDYFKNITLVKNKVLNYNGIATLIYKPYHYQTTELRNGDLEFDICNSEEIGDKYYSLINVIQDEDFIKNNEDLKSAFRKYKITGKSLAKCSLGTEYRESYEKMFQLKNNISGDTVYCFDLSNFVLVPFFIKQKALCENKFFLSTAYSDWRTKDIITSKDVIIEKGTKWLCKEVTLLKNDEDKYDFNYILISSIGQTIAVNKGNWRGGNNYFTSEEIILAKERDAKLKQEEIIAKQQQIEKTNNRKQQIEKEKRRTECINKYGEYNGNIIAQNKVQIGFNQDMCKSAWGTPFTTNKTTTEFNVNEDWYYIRGCSLHFENGILKTIEEK